MKNVFKVLAAMRSIAIIALVAVIGFTIACDSGDDGGSTQPPADGFTSIASFKTWLDAQPDNTAATAYNVKLNVSDLGGGSYEEGSLGYALNFKSNHFKYVSLDLYGSTFTSIGENAFNKCSSLTSLTIPNSVTSIGGGAFYYCTSLTSLTIPDNVTSIGGYAFTNCKSLTSVTIPDSVTSIGGYAFTNCESLTSVTIGNGVTSIGGNAFSSCTSLTSVTFATGSNIPDANFENHAFPEGSDGYGGNTLKTAYNNAATKAGTYTRSANGSTWTKQP